MQIFHFILPTRTRFMTDMKVWAKFQKFKPNIRLIV